METLFVEGPWGWLALLVFAVLVHEPWRWAGYALGRGLNPDGEFFKWVKFVSTALVAALVARLLLFSSGALGTVAMEVRLGAVAAGVGLYMLTGKTWQGVCLTAVIIGAGKHWLV